MKVNSVLGAVSFRANKSVEHKKLNKYTTVPVTGYASLGLAFTSSILASQKKMKAHKVTALLALAAGATHVALLKTLHRFGNKKAEK